MRSWTDYVTPYETYILLTLIFGLALLFVCFVRMKRFRFLGTKSGRWFYSFFYGLSNHDLLCLSALTSRLFLVTGLVLSGQELRLSHIVCLAVLSALCQWSGKVNPAWGRALAGDLLQMAGTCAGLLVYWTLLNYMADVRFAWDIRITSILLGIFIVIYNVVLYLNRLPQLGWTDKERPVRKEAAHEKE
ncbi:MAG: hypothetical protein LIO86_03580 [Lachnospiraceae bacterium]|nr:hypothetical protein [Lachnospiraceae bacterium]